MLVVSGFFWLVSGAEDHVELLESYHGHGDMAEEVVALDGVTDVQSTVTHANEVDVIVIFLLLNQVGFDPVLDGLIG